MSPILHGGCQRQCLAAGAGAEVEYLLAGLGVAEQCGELRRLVLELHQAVLEGACRGDIRLRRTAQAPGAHGRGDSFDLVPVKALDCFGELRLERVHPQVHRWDLEGSLHLTGKGRAESLAQPGLEVGWTFQPHGFRHGGVVDPTAGEAAHQGKVLDASQVVPMSSGGREDLPGRHQGGGGRLQFFLLKVPGQPAAVAIDGVEGLDGLAAPCGGQRAGRLEGAGDRLVERGPLCLVNQGVGNCGLSGRFRALRRPCSLM